MTVVLAVLAGWVALSVVLGLAVGRAFAAGQLGGGISPVAQAAGRPAASPALRR